MRNDFEKMCKGLAKMKKCGCPMCVPSNEYVCAYNAVRDYVGKDENKFLKLKAEAQSSDYGAFLSNIMSAVSFVVATLTLMVTIYFDVFSTNIELKKGYAIMVLVAVLAFSIAIWVLMHYYKDTSKWKGYILVALEKIENPENQDSPYKK